MVYLGKDGRVTVSIPSEVNLRGLLITISELPNDPRFMHALSVTSVYDADALENCARLIREYHKAKKENSEA
jgi:hypothetical protein